jgi:hypothetical protein
MPAEPERGMVPPMTHGATALRLTLNWPASAPPSVMALMTAGELLELTNIGSAAEVPEEPTPIKKPAAPLGLKLSAGPPPAAHAPRLMKVTAMAVHKRTC